MTTKLLGRDSQPAFLSMVAWSHCNVFWRWPLITIWIYFLQLQSGNHWWTWNMIWVEKRSHVGTLGTPKNKSQHVFHQNVFGSRMFSQHFSTPMGYCCGPPGICWSLHQLDAYCAYELHSWQWSAYTARVCIYIYIYMYEDSMHVNLYVYYILIYTVYLIVYVVL